MFRSVKMGNCLTLRLVPYRFTQQVIPTIEQRPVLPADKPKSDEPPSIIINENYFA